MFTALPSGADAHTILPVEAPTVGVEAAITSLGQTPPAAGGVKLGDGPFRAGDQVGPPSHLG